MKKFFKTLWLAWKSTTIDIFNWQSAVLMFAFGLVIGIIGGISRESWEFVFGAAASSTAITAALYLLVFIDEFREQYRSIR